MDYKDRARQFGVRLRELRNKKAVNMAYVADRVGIARSTYAGYETQERFPPIETLAKVAAVLSTSTDYLIGLTDNPEPKELPKNVNEYLTAMEDLNWDGVPLSNDDLKPIRDLFNLVMKERLPKIIKEHQDQEPEQDQGSK